MFLQDVQAMVGIWICVLRANQSMTSCKHARNRHVIRAHTTIRTIQLAKRQKLAVWMSMFVVKVFAMDGLKQVWL